MNKNKGQLTQTDLRVAIICGSLLFVGGILLGWAILNISPISSFWPGLLIGFCITLLILYSIVKSSKKIEAKNATKNSVGSSLGGIGAGLGSLFLAVFREYDALMVNIAGAAISLLMGIGLLSIVMALLGNKNKNP